MAVGNCHGNFITAQLVKITETSPSDGIAGGYDKIKVCAKILQDRQNIFICIFKRNNLNFELRKLVIYFGPQIHQHFTRGKKGSSHPDEKGGAGSRFPCVADQTVIASQQRFGVFIDRFSGFRQGNSPGRTMKLMIFLYEVGTLRLADFHQ